MVATEVAGVVVAVAVEVAVGVNVGVEVGVGVLVAGVGDAGLPAKHLCLVPDLDFLQWWGLCVDARRWETLGGEEAPAREGPRARTGSAISTTSLSDRRSNIYSQSGNSLNSSRARLAANRRLIMSVTSAASGHVPATVRPAFEHFRKGQYLFDDTTRVERMPARYLIVNVVCVEIAGREGSRATTFTFRFDPRTMLDLTLNRLCMNP